MLKRRHIFFGYAISFSEEIDKSDNWIKEAQIILRKNGFYGGPATGVMDGTTEAAIERAVAPFDAILNLMDDEQLENYTKEIINLYNIRFEYMRHLAHPGSGNLLISKPTLDIPPGRFRSASREGGDFEHIESIREIEFKDDGTCEVYYQFVNHTNADVNEQASLSGDCFLISIHREDRETEEAILFQPKMKAGSNWQIDDLFDLLLMAAQFGLYKIIIFEENDTNTLLFDEPTGLRRIMAETVDPAAPPKEVRGAR